MEDNGKGKTLSCVKRIKELKEKYPQTTLISNVVIKGIENVEYFENADKLVELLKKIDIKNNKGYIIFIDEIHVVLADLFLKIDPIFLQFLSQQRKLSIHIIGSSQMYDRLPKFIREYLVQSGQIILCNKIFNVIQINKWAEMEEVEEDSKNAIILHKVKLKYFIHTIDLYESYDTYAVISQIKNMMKGRQDNGIRLSVNTKPITEI